MAAWLPPDTALGAYRAGQMATVQGWFAALGDAAIADHPPLAVLAGWLAALTGQPVDAQRWAATVERASFDEVPVDGTASFASSRAMLRAIMCPAGPEQMVADANFAVDHEPPWSLWRNVALQVRAEALLLTGELDEAVGALAASCAAVPAGNNDDTLALAQAERALLAMDRGRWDDAAAHVDLALAVIEQRRRHDYAVCLLAFAAAARLAVYRGDLKAADRHLTQAMLARPLLTSALPFLAVRLRLQLAKVYRSRSDDKTARQLLREIDDILHDVPDLGVLVDQVDELRAALASSHATGANSGRR